MAFKKGKKRYDAPDFDDVTMEHGDLEDVDIKVNPDFYVHKALVKLQDALLNENLKEGLIRFRLITDHIEVLAKSARMVGLVDYDEKVAVFERGLKGDDREMKLFKVANYKVELIMSEIFSAKTINQPVRF